MSLRGDGAIGGNPDAQTSEGFAELVRDIEEETGGTTVFWVGLYDGFAVVDVPFADDDRELSYRWDGGFDEPRKGTSTDERFDLADVDPAVVDGMCDEVLAMVEDPQDCYIFIEKPDPTFASRTWIRTMASNEFGQSATVEYDLEGNEVARHEP
ncbi:hypothetical protein [Nocardioides sp. TF02-7]|uniref:hypothetical protein n=1 Tax=Nocardioides sp. TF02-7 TaxID=2917724 RepID=UPI001F06475D|nr:hypothetical protein [Nocardioides sp. TF02-7]UMG93541.1 hypothetical protein MF408_04915 [Nocardioides sp. TF02-7]